MHGVIFQLAPWDKERCFDSAKTQQMRSAGANERYYSNLLTVRQEALCVDSVAINRRGLKLVENDARSGHSIRVTKAASIGKLVQTFWCLVHYLQIHYDIEEA